MSDDEILRLRICDLKLRIPGTELESRIETFYGELAAKGISVKPLCYLGEEWFCPEGCATIAIPFYLAHPRLKKLEEKMMMEVEGGTESWCLRLLRHEMGHVLNHTYLLEKDKKWRKLFGSPSLEYSESYRARPYSKRFVRHLEGWYAQSHPEEDFAETFAVWLTPRSNWRKRYAGWPALKKLNYVDELMAEIAEQRPQMTRRRRTDPLNKYKITLAEYYEKKQALYAVDTPKTYDRELHRLFSADPKYRRRRAASTFLRKNRTKIRQMVAKWTGEHQFTLDSVIDDMIDRCRELKLRAVGPERQLKIDFIVLLTAKTVHSLYGPKRRQWFAL